MSFLKKKLGKIWRYIKVFVQLISALNVLVPFVLTVVSYLALLINIQVLLFPSWFTQVMIYIAIILTIVTGFILTEKYIRRTQTRFFSLREFYSYFEQFGEFLQNHAYSYSICSMFGNIQTDDTKNKYFTQIFENLAQKYKKLKEDLKQTEMDGDFPSKAREFNEIIEGHSKLIIDFVQHFRNANTIEIVKRPQARQKHEHYDEYYEPFREKYNHFLLSYNRYLIETKSLHGERLLNLEDKLLAPRLFYVYASFEKE